MRLGRIPPYFFGNHLADVHPSLSKGNATQSGNAFWE